MINNNINFKKRVKKYVALFGGMLVSSLAFANPSNVYVFGDSLSDNGNAKVFSGNTDPNNSGRASNGLVAVEYVANGLGFTLTPSLFLLGSEQGNNYAVGGAKATDNDGDETTFDTNLPTQVNTFLAYNGGIAPSDAQYIVIIGGNDLFAAQNILSGTVFASTVDERDAIKAAAREYVKNAVATIENQLNKLVAAGAENILVANAPDIGDVPATDLLVAQLVSNASSQEQLRRAEKMHKKSSRLSALFNRKLARVIGRLERKGSIDIVEYDLAGFLLDQVANKDDYGYLNVEDGCLSPAYGIHPECDFPTATGFVFWDLVHPTTQVHQKAAQEILELIQQ